jgi:CheY-like chemotaxis protein
MVVEDEPDIYDVLLAMFEIWGIDGVAFVDGAEAVAWIEDVDKGSAVGELPELAILDIRLPEVSGPEVGARLRKSERLGRTAIVLITAYRLGPEEEEAVKARAQADTLMYKPLPAMPELRKILDTIIGRRRALQAVQQPAPTIASSAQPVHAVTAIAPIPPSQPMVPPRPASAPQPTPQPTQQTHPAKATPPATAKPAQSQTAPPAAPGSNSSTPPGSTPAPPQASTPLPPGSRPPPK